MEQHLRELFIKYLDSDESIRTPAIEELSSLYKDPANISPLLSLLRIDQTDLIRKEAAIGLSYILQNCWKTINEAEQIQLLNVVLEILSLENVPKIRHIIIDSLEPIFRANSGTLEPVLEFWQSLTDPQNLNSFELCLYLMNSVLEFLTIADAMQLLENIVKVIQDALNSEVVDLIVSGARLCATFFETIELERDHMSVLYHLILNVLVTLMKSSSESAFEVMNSLVKIIKQAEKFADSTELADEFLAIAANAELPIETRILIARPLASLIKCRPEDFEGELVQRIVVSVMTLGLECVNEDCFEEQTAVTFVMSPIEKLCRFAEVNDVFQEIWNAKQFESAEAAIVACAALIPVVQYRPDLYAPHFVEVFGFIESALSSNDHRVKEAGMQLCRSVALENSELLQQVISTLLEQFKDYCKSEHSALISGCLTFMLEFLSVCKVDDALVDPILALLLECMKEFPTKHLEILAAIMAFCHSVEESLCEHSGIIEEVCGCAMFSDSLPKALGLEILGCLCRYVPNDARITSFYRALEGITIDDIDLYRSALLGLGTIAKGQTFSGDSEACLRFISPIMEFDIESDDIKGATAIYENLLRIKGYALKFVYAMLKYHSDSIAPFLETLTPLVLSHFSVAVSSLAGISMKCLIQIVKITKVIPEGFLDSVACCFDDRNMEIAQLGFRTWSRLLQIGLEYDESTLRHLKAAMETSFQALSFEMVCQTKCDLDNDLRADVFDLLANLGEHCPDMYPVDFIIEIIQQSAETDLYTSMELIGTLIEYYAVARAKIPSQTIKLIHGFILEALPQCDGNVPPHCISGLQCMFEFDRKLPRVTAVMKTIREIMNMEFAYQPYYWETIASCVSLVLTMNRSDFDMRDILTRVPKALFPASADNILQHVLGLWPEFSNEILNIAFLIMSFRNSRLRKLGLSESTLSRLRELVREHIATAERELSPICYQRLLSRVSD